ncbi:type II secretion system F family protein [Nocardioidaceae bacterium]|nr:type II secretion system F family protein [Nocardioidaceae bacterium]
MSVVVPAVAPVTMLLAAAAAWWLLPLSGPGSATGPRPGSRGAGARRLRRGAAPRTERDGPVSPRSRVMAAGSLLLVGNLALGPGVGTAAGVVAAVGVWVWLRRQEPPGESRRRARLAADLPHAVDLLAALLRAGQAPTEAAGLVGRTVEGPAGETMSAVARRAAAGLDAYAVWRPVAEQEATALLGSAMLRSLDSGARVVEVVDRVAEELRREARAAATAHAKAVGVRATLPLAACFLPALLCIGVVPFVASLVVPLLGGL